MSDLEEIIKQLIKELPYTYSIEKKEIFTGNAVTGVITIQFKNLTVDDCIRLEQVMAQHNLRLYFGDALYNEQHGPMGRICLARRE